MTDTFRILVLASEPEIGDQMAALLPSRQRQVQLADNEAIAYEILRNQTVAAVVADIDASSLNGLAVLEHCHRHFPSLAVYAITALPHLATRKELARKACGVRGFFYLLDGSLQLDANQNLAARLIAGCTG